MDPNPADKRGRDGLPPRNPEKKPVEIDHESRLAKRKYARAYRSRKQGQFEGLHINVENLKAEIAQKNEKVNAQDAKNSTARSEFAALKQKRDDKVIRTRSIDEETERLVAKIEKLERKMVAKQRAIENDPRYMELGEENKKKYGDILGVFFPYDSDMPPQ